MGSHRIPVLVAALGAALFIFGGLTQAADTSLPIYFPDSKIIVKADVMNRSLYVPIREIVAHLGLPYTDSIALETLTIRSGSNQLVVTKNSALISYNGQIILLPSPILREDRWLAPVEFLTMGLSKMTGTDFRYRPGTSRIFVGNVDPPELEMNAQTLGSITRLTLRSSSPINIDVKREDPTKAVLAINVSPMDPARERLDHRDRLLRTVSFDDSDGQSKIVLDIAREVSDIRVTPANNNRIFFVDLLRGGESVSATPAPPTVEPPPAVAAGKPDAPAANRRVRVVVIDPGHGGMDTGVKTPSASEKDLTLALARRLRTALQMRLGATVLLTRDSDIAMDNEARSAVANNNQANLFISLHVGYSQNKSEATSGIFIMRDGFGDTGSQAVGKDQLFLPWYLGYKVHRSGSSAAAKLLQEELLKGISGWKFPVRTAPLAVLSSAAMPSLLFEIGNLNNSVNAQTLLDVGFQAKLVNSMVDAIQRFSETPPAAAN
jgi:N-acetylmuramoyl-L-alanine amidase